MSHDPLVRIALDARAQLREEFEAYRWGEYQKAEEATRGAMLNERGRKAGVDAYDLFMGNWATAAAYASAELMEWWRSHERPIFARYAESLAPGILFTES